MFANFVVNFLNTRTSLFTKLLDYYYKLLKIWGGAKSIVGPPNESWGGAVTLISTGSGPHGATQHLLYEYGTTQCKSQPDTLDTNYYFIAS